LKLGYLSQVFQERSANIASSVCIEMDFLDDL